jgi:hypothetical protein
MIHINKSLSLSLAMPPPPPPPNFSLSLSSPGYWIQLFTRFEKVDDLVEYDYNDEGDEGIVPTNDEHNGHAYCRSK